MLYVICYKLYFICYKLVSTSEIILNHGTCSLTQNHIHLIWQYNQILIADQTRNELKVPFLLSANINK